MTEVMTKPRVQIEETPRPDDIALHCPKCGGFITAIEPPEPAPAADVAFGVRLYCKRCSHKFRRTVTFRRATPPVSP